MKNSHTLPFIGIRATRVSMQRRCARARALFSPSASSASQLTAAALDQVIIATQHTKRKKAQIHQKHQFFLSSFVFRRDLVFALIFEHDFHFGKYHENQNGSFFLIRFMWPTFLCFFSFRVCVYGNDSLSVCLIEIGYKSTHKSRVLYFR